MEPLRVGFLGSSLMSHALLRTAATLPNANIVGTATALPSDKKGDFFPLDRTARQVGVTCTRVADDDALVEWLANMEADVLFCFGWNKLLPQQVRDMPRLGTIGYHPSPLPIGRGRHPIIWTLVLGLPRTASTFFRLADGADDGDILLQEDVPVWDSDSATSLYDRLTGVAQQQLMHLVKGLHHDTLIPMQQDDAEATYWRRRSEADGIIDWRMPAEGVHNLVRALTDPYPGATMIVDGDQIPVREVEVHSVNVGDTRFAVNEPGRVLAADNDRGCFDVRSGSGIVRVLNHDLAELPRVGDHL
jgi:methionyl-tRNA formyltransferase